MDNNSQSFFEAQEKIVTSTFSHAKAYSQIVTGVGYVGLFAAWSFTKDILTPVEILWSALLATISLATFVIFEVINTLFISLNLISLSQAVKNPLSFPRKIVDHEKRMQKVNGFHCVVWAIQWIVAVITGVGAAGILFLAFVSHLLELS